MANIRAQGVSKTFRGKGVLVEAVKQVDVEIGEGEFAVFVGPSGSGKTTFLRLVAGLELPTNGQIWIGNREVTTTHPRARGVAMVFQDYALYPHMTVRQNMAFALENLKHPRTEIEQRVKQTAELLQIGELLDRRPRELSGGQRQRVAVGRAIVRQPEAFLFDEPLSNLDAKLRVQMRVELAELHRRLGATTLYVTHDQVEAMTLGERIFVMNGGVIQQVGSGSTLYEQPANTFVAAFLGSPPMNLLPARLEAGGVGLVVAADTLRLPLPPELSRRYQAFAPCAVTFGIRPEQISPRHSATTAAPGWTPVAVHLLLTEHLGSEKLVYFTIGEQRLVAKIPEDAPLAVFGAGQLAFNMNRVHLFDGKTGMALV
jgi:multiple sugar transport system ATP-binding protein